MNETLEGMAQALFKSWFVDFDPVIDNALAAGNPIPEPLAQRAETRRQAIANGTANREAAQAFPASFRFTEELGYIPEGWEESDVGNVSSCYDKNRIPLSKKQREEKKPGLIPYYGATSVMDYINEWIFDDTFLLVGEDGSVMKDDGTPFTQYIWGKTWVNNHAHVLQGKGSISTEHLMLFMQSQNVTAFVTGAVQMKINQGNLNSIPFLKAEDSTNEVFGETISPIYQNIKNRIVESQTLAKLRDVLLPKLISGELRIPQAEKMVGDAIA
jgi:type I restriction enzyme S subunit